jgi:HlyD family secretion protein
VTVRRRDGALLRQFRTLYNIGAIGDLTDGQLLERFATDADEAAELAFSALVERHEALIWRVCRAITRDEHAAEDAFQATLLVLVRKARSL